MKRTHLILAGFLLCIGCSLQAKNRVIDRPPFIVRNTTSIEVSKVVVSDTATVLHISAKYRPKFWIQIAPESYLTDNNGERYPLRSGIGITPGKHFWMPESGEAEFQLVFPPLSGKATSIDFTEGEGVQGCFSIWGIQLKSKKLPKQEFPANATAHKADPEAELPAPAIRYGKATLKGQLLDYRATISAGVTLWENLKGDVTNMQLDIQPDGSFRQEVTLLGTTPCTMTIGSGQSLQFFMEPDQTTEIQVNMREVCRRESKFHSEGKPYGELAYINGPLATVAQEINRLGSGYDAQEKLFQELTVLSGKDPDETKAYILQLSGETQDAIDHAACSASTHQLLTIHNQLGTLYILSSVADLLISAALQAKLIEREKANDYYRDLLQKVPAGYVPYEDLAILNVPQAALSPLYARLVARYTAFLLSDIPAKAWGTDEGIFFNTARSLMLYHNIKDFTPLTDEQKATAATLPAAYGEMLDAANGELLALIEANKQKNGYVTTQVDENVSNEDLFAAITGKHKGKVILIDFWATWCGPCRMANKAMAPMKEELKDKEIVYLYIAGENSPLKTWENMIADIHGEHLRLTAGQWDYLSKTFKIEGVPTYMIIDREGNIRLKQTGFQSVEFMKNELLKAAGD